MVRNQVWSASTLVGPAAPVARDHDSLFHPGSHHDPGYIAVDRVAPPQVRSLPVRRVLRKKVVMFRANIVGVPVRIPGQAVQVEEIAPGAYYMLTAS